MSKSYAEMADDILNGALTDPAKNPYDPATGHQASMPAMDPNDRLVEMNDSQRNLLLAHAGVDAEPLNEAVRETPQPQPQVVTPQEVDTLNEALRIIQKIQEATTVGNLGVNMAGPSGDAKSVKLPGDTNTSTPKKRVKKKTNKQPLGNDFLSYLKA